MWLRYVTIGGDADGKHRYGWWLRAWHRGEAPAFNKPRCNYSIWLIPGTYLEE